MHTQVDSSSAMQTPPRFVREPSYSADKSKTRFAPRSRLRLFIRRLFSVELPLPGPNGPPTTASRHLRRSQHSPFVWAIGIVALLFLLVVYFRPFRTPRALTTLEGYVEHKLHNYHILNGTDPDVIAHSNGTSDNDFPKLDDDHPDLGDDKDNDKDKDKDADDDDDGAGADDDGKKPADLVANGGDGDAEDKQADDDNKEADDEEDNSKDIVTEETENKDGQVLNPPSGGTRFDHSNDKPMRITHSREGMKLAINDDAVRDKYAATKMSIVVLFHNEYGSLNTALASWIKYNLVDYADEVLFFLNGVSTSTNFRAQVPAYEGKIPENKRRIVLSKENLPLGLAIARMVELAKYETILLLEKDWELIENEEVMKSRLIDSKVLVGTGVAQVVRHRHRNDPGVPLHALIMHQGREESIFRQQPNLLCYSHHWIKDPSTEYPGAGYMKRCGGAGNHVEEEDVFCAAAEYCNWSNNPAVFRKKWFMDEVGDRYRKEYDIEKGKYGLTSPFLDFEYYTNWRRYAWTEKNITVALGAGLFRHAESEHRHFNTFWYAHYRLTVDLEEIRNFYLKNETKFKRLGGVHYDTKYPKPVSMSERYPVDFVRKFHWPDTFTGTLKQQREAVNKVYSEYLQTYRVTSEEWNGQGAMPEKGKKLVPWRPIVTNIHNEVEKAMMLVPPIQPHEMNITLVTSLLDIGRHGLANDGYQFRREFKMYLDAMEDWLKHKYSKVVYTSEQIRDILLETASDEVKATTKFIITSSDKLRSKWLGPDNFAKVQELRQSEAWRARASWLANSPQAGLEYYNPLVMSKMYMVRDAARENPFGTTHFVFVDAKHNCRKPDLMTPLNDHILRAHMVEKFLMTTFDYTPNEEVHGFAYEQFNSWCNLPEPEKKQNVRVGRGGIFGGNAFVMEYITAAYDVILTATLRENLMGTEENIFSIVMYNLRQYVDEFSNNWACPDVIEKDHECKNMKDHQGYNCAIFEWAARDAVPWKPTTP